MAVLDAVHLNLERLLHAGKGGMPALLEHCPPSHYLPSDDWRDPYIPLYFAFDRSTGEIRYLSLECLPASGCFHVVVDPPAPIDTKYYHLASLTYPPPLSSQASSTLTHTMIFYNERMLFKRPFSQSVRW